MHGGGAAAPGPAPRRTNKRETKRGIGFALSRALIGEIDARNYPTRPSTRPRGGRGGAAAGELTCEGPLGYSVCPRPDIREKRHASTAGGESQGASEAGRSRYLWSEGSGGWNWPFSVTKVRTHDRLFSLNHSRGSVAPLERLHGGHNSWRFRSSYRGRGRVNEPGRSGKGPPDGANLTQYAG